MVWTQIRMHNTCILCYDILYYNVYGSIVEKRKPLNVHQKANRHEHCRNNCIIGYLFEYHIPPEQITEHDEIKITNR